MQNAKLKEALEELRAEINRADMSDGQARDRLNSLITELEKRIEHPADQKQDASLIDNLKDSIGQLEVEHPRATTILNQIMTSLGGIGI